MAPGGRQKCIKPSLWAPFDRFQDITPLPSITSAISDINHSPIIRMRLSIITLLCPLFIFVFATKFEDEASIKGLNSKFNRILDTKQYSKLGEVLSLDVTYNAGAGPVQGLPAAISILSKVIPNTTTSYSSVGTQLVKFLPPYDKENRSNLAEAISYSTLTFFGTGNLTGEFFIIFAKYVDKEIVRTKEPGFGGWRFKNRRIESVGQPIGNPAVLRL